MAFIILFRYSRKRVSKLFVNYTMHFKHSLACLLSVALSSTAIAQEAPTEKMQRLLDSAKIHAKDNRYPMFLSQAAALADKEDDAGASALLHQRLGHYYYDKFPKLSINNNKKAYEQFLKDSNERQAAMCLHSIGFVFEEHLNKHDSAINYIQQAIAMHEKLHDTSELANMNKYVGVLYAKTGRFAEGKSYVDKAIKTYKEQRYEPGIAVCQYDMATIYLLQKKFDSSLYYLKQAKTYWQRNKNQSRILNVNNQIVAAYMMSRKQEEALKAMNENDKMLGSKGLYYGDVLKHYQNKSQFYMLKKDKEKAYSYRNRYMELKDSLVKQGIKINPSL